MSELKIWRSNEGEYVIAASAAEAIAIYAKESGYPSLAEYCKDTMETEDDWTALPDEVLFPFTMELDEDVTVETLELKPGEVLRRHGEPPTTAVVEYRAGSDGVVRAVTRRKLACEWCAEFGEPSYFASENC